ncbi:MAG: hypothetical protein M3255_09300 [Pseudomonadota bacterium]|nr:hypothetical protein [Pseudomonadota bacterium]
MISMKVTGRLFFTGFVIVVFSPAMVSAASGQALFCTKTSQAANIACQHEVKNEFWIATGICDNVADPNAREECKDAA